MQYRLKLCKSNFQDQLPKFELMLHNFLSPAKHGWH